MNFLLFLFSLAFMAACLALCGWEMRREAQRMDAFLRNPLRDEARADEADKTRTGAERDRKMRKTIR